MTSPGSFPDRSDGPAEATPPAVVPVGSKAVALAQPGLSWAAGLAVVTASTALAGVLSGWTWLGAVIVTVGLVVLTGTVLRALRLPPGLVAAGQLLALSCLLTARFTEDGLLGIIPTPEAAATLGRLIADGAAQIETSLPPVPTTIELLMLITVALGLVAIAVDVLAVPGRAPAAVGLVLLCVVAIPVALVDDGLPVWTLACGAIGFAVLLAANRSRWGRPGWVAGTAVALGLALAVGTLATGVGTSGRALTGGAGAGALGLNPFTSLRGSLENPNSFELLQVRGMAEPGYLRAVTLAEYVPQRGWQIGDTGDTVPLSDDLPGAGGGADAEQVELAVSNVAYRDNWLPLYGVPLGVSGLNGQVWSYDPLTGVVRSEDARQEAAWRQRAAVPGASADVLRQAPDRAAADRGRLDARYTDTAGIDERVTELARQVTRDADTDFDRAVALNEYFLDPANGFTYSLQTAPGNTGDALVDFLTRGRAGYCEQFASAMAVMLRAVGVPSRVAVGFTAGVDTGAVPLGRLPRRARLGGGLLSGPRLADVRSDTAGRRARRRTAVRRGGHRARGRPGPGRPAGTGAATGTDRAAAGPRGRSGRGRPAATAAAAGAGRRGLGRARGARHGWVGRRPRRAAVARPSPPAGDRGIGRPGGGLGRLAGGDRRVGGPSGGPAADGHRPGRGRPHDPPARPGPDRRRGDVAAGRRGRGGLVRRARSRR